MNELLTRVTFWGERPHSRGKAFPMVIYQQDPEILEHQLVIVRFQQMFLPLRPHAGPPPSHLSGEGNLQDCYLCATCDPVIPPLSFSFYHD